MFRGILGLLVHYNNKVKGLRTTVSHGPKMRNLMANFIVEGLHADLINLRRSKCIFPKRN